MSSEPTPAPARFPGHTPFSYDCLRCKRCCHDKLIQVNPYETARMARHLGISTTEFRRDYLEQGVYLRRVAEGACVFLGEQGCGVHADRPLVCRLYPLGRHVGGEEGVLYSQVKPHPQSEGLYGTAGTAEAFVEAQGAGPFIAAADQYLEVLACLIGAWRRERPSEGDGEPATAVDEPPDFNDLDAALSSHCALAGVAEPADVEERMRLHLAIIRAWLREHP